MKKQDYYLIGIVIALACTLLGYQYFQKKDGAYVIVTQDGQIIGRYSLAEDNKMVLSSGQGGRNVLCIEEGKAYISEADCPDQLCVRQKSISKNGEAIICLPHRFVIEIVGGEDKIIDSVTG